MSRRRVELVALALAACGASSPATRGGGDALLLVSCPLADATVWVDERLIGEVRDVRGGILVDPGPHRVEIRRELHYPKYVEVDARPGERRPVACDLVPEPE